MLTAVAVVIGIVIGAAVLWIWLRTASASRLRLAEDQRRAILADADRDADTTCCNGAIGYIELDAATAGFAYPNRTVPNGRLVVGHEHTC